MDLRASDGAQPEAVIDKRLREPLTKTENQKECVNLCVSATFSKNDAEK